MKLPVLPLKPCPPAKLCPLNPSPPENPWLPENPPLKPWLPENPPPPENPPVLPNPPLLLLVVLRDPVVPALPDPLRTWAEVGVAKQARKRTEAGKGHHAARVLAVLTLLSFPQPGLGAVPGTEIG
jgi:hypothetical protein